MEVDDPRRQELARYLREQLLANPELTLEELLARQPDLRALCDELTLIHTLQQVYRSPSTPEEEAVGARVLDRLMKLVSEALPERPGDVREDDTPAHE